MDIVSIFKKLLLPSDYEIKKIPKIYSVERPGNDKYIIEFFGCSGVGKSTIYKEVNKSNNFFRFDKNIDGQNLDRKYN